MTHSYLKSVILLHEFIIIAERRISMIKSLKNLIISTGVMMACSGMVFADGNAFTPLNFDDVSYNPQQGRVVASSNVSSQSSISNTTVSPQEVTGGTDMQSAILKLDNAQVDVRNELLNYRAKYNDIDQQYKTIKAERKALKQKVKDTEKKIKELDKIKEKTRQQMI